MRTIAIPCISTGLYNFPSAEAARIAVAAVAEWFDAHWKIPLRVHFMLWTDTDVACYHAAMADVFPDATPELRVRMCDLRPDPGVFDDVAGLVIHAGAGLSADAVGALGMGLDYTSPELFEALYPGIVRSTPLRTLYETIGYEWDDVSGQRQLARSAERAKLETQGH